MRIHLQRAATNESGFTWFDVDIPIRAKTYPDSGNGGRYRIVEVKAPAGYLLDSTPVDVEFTYEGQQIAWQIVDGTNTNLRTSVDISKQDITNGKELPGAKLEIRDTDGNLVEGWTSGKVPHTVRGLELEKEYTLTETRAPDGYAEAESIVFKLVQEGTEQVNEVYVKSDDDWVKLDDATVIMQDAPVLDIDKTDIAGNLLPGATLTIRDADSVLDACLQHDPASRVACEVMATHGHIIVAGEITTSAKPDVFNIVRDTLRDVGYDPKAYQIDCYIHDQSPDIAGAVEPELAEGEDEDTLGAGDQGVMVGYACNETPEYLPMPVVAAQRLVTLLEISRMTGVIPDIGPDGKVQVTMEYNGDTPVRITTVVVSVQHKEDTDMDKLADLLDEYVFPLAFDGMPADDAEIILNPSGKFVQGGPDADTGLTGRKLMVDSYGTFAPHGGGAFSGKDATKVDRSGAYMARYIAKNMVAAHLADRCQVTLAYAIGEKDPVMVDVNTFGTGGPCEDDCLSAAVRKAYDLTPAGIIKQLNLLNPIYSRTAAGGHFGREDFPWENVEHMSDLAAYIV